MLNNMCGQFVYCLQSIHHVNKQLNHQIRRERDNSFPSFEKRKTHFLTRMMVEVMINCK